MQDLGAALSCEGSNQPVKNLQHRRKEIVYSNSDSLTVPPKLSNLQHYCNMAFVLPTSLCPRQNFSTNSVQWKRPNLCAVAQGVSNDPNQSKELISSKETPLEPPISLPNTKVYAPRQIRGGGRLRIGHVRKQGKRYVKLPPNPPGLRVSAGTAKGRPIRSPNVYLRPMMAKVREALFSILDSCDAIRSDGCVLDLFCGSGSVGIEGLSRGMGSAVFVDFASECIETTDGNLANCGFASRGRTVCSRVEDFIPNGHAFNNGRHYDLITITPPYEEVNYEELMTLLIQSNCIGEGTFVVVEYPLELKTLPPTIGYRLIGVRNRRYGRTVLAMYACQPDVSLDLRPEEFTPLKRHK